MRGEPSLNEVDGVAPVDEDHNLFQINGVCKFESRFENGSV